MSEDKFWEQLTGASGSGAQQAGSEATAPANTAGVDADVLAAWLRALPADESLLAPEAPAAQAVPTQAPGTAEPQAWPPSAPVDPFAGLARNPGEAPGGSDWDLSFAQPAAAPPAAAAPPPAAPPTVLAAPAAAPPSPAAVPPPSTSDFILEGPPTTSAAPAAPATPVTSPFGPPPPPAAPPREALEAPPLRVLVTSGRRTTEQLIRGEALIGRPDATRRIHPEIDLRMDDAVSRRHAKIFYQGGRYVLTDLNSTNGTRHNQRWLAAEVVVPLNPGDEIEVGEISLIKILEAPQQHA